MNSLFRNSILTVILTITFLFSSRATFGWGAIGHNAIKEKATEEMTDDAKKGVDDLFSDLPSDQLANVANFPDLVRHSHGWEHTSSYHFADIPKGAEYFSNLKARIEAVQQKGEDLSSAGDVVQTILRALDILRDYTQGKADKASAATAAKFLIHMIGDAHQPLHVGYPEDLGANRIIDGSTINGKVVKYILQGKQPARWNGRPINLHAVWDEIIIGITYEKLFGSLRPNPVEAGKLYSQHLGKPSESDFADWIANLSPEAWAMEEREALIDIYNDVVAFNSDLDQYIPKYGPLVDKRIFQGGIRLSTTLNQIFDPQGPQISSDEAALRMKLGTIYTACNVSLANIIRLTQEDAGVDTAPRPRIIQPEPAHVQTQ